MLDNHLIAQTKPLANEKNIIFWGNYRVTVLQDRLFRLEYSENKKFRDGATQVVWYRNMPKQDFIVLEENNQLVISTVKCKLIIRERREDCRIELSGKTLEISNKDNLFGTYRTLDCCDGSTHIETPWDPRPTAEIELNTGVCSLSGVAVLDDSKSLILDEDGMPKPVFADGLDEYIFAYGDDYRDAIKALYMITGNPPMIPRFALGIWWSRYHVYTDKEYLKVLNSFEENDIPLTVATIDMDWHYSNEQELEELFHITELGRMNREYLYALNTTWTGYTWNPRLFPNYKGFLQKIKKKNLKITLNLHPADGVRYWENQYVDMANAMGQDPTEGKYVPFDITDEKFINAYFKILHKPYENDGVDFWWIDWQQGTTSKVEGLDPLWALNHYHYLDNAVNHNVPLILTRYYGAGSHRYPLGFSGDTFMTWKSLEYWPYFTATSTNIGYTWWSHDIGGHLQGEKNNELFVRHMQYGIFSPFARLHCSNLDVCTKEPWYFGNGAGDIAKNWLRLRHKLIPYLYTATYHSHKEGRALVEPLYYEWKNKSAYSYKNEYLFGEQLLVIPITKKAGKDKLGKVKAWIPEGIWTDIFTGTEYIAPVGGKCLVLCRELESIPVLIRAGGILPLSLELKNGAKNPKKMEINVYKGNGEFELYEDGAEINRSGELFTKFIASNQIKGDIATQTLSISTNGDWSVVPKTRNFLIRFKNIKEGTVRVWKNNRRIKNEEILTNCVAVNLNVVANAEYRIEISYTKISPLEKLKNHAMEVLIRAESDNLKKNKLYEELRFSKTADDFWRIVNNCDYLPNRIKKQIKELK